LFGRRLGWYALVRLLRPKVIVETGVDRGHGALLLCAALLRNAKEGHPGRYFGTDINPAAGWLLSGPYAAAGTILYGDSLQSLSKLDEKVDLFINDSDHSAAYEYEEYLALDSKFSPKAVIASDNAHVTDRLALYSEQRQRSFVFFREEPDNHWYPGAGIGLSFIPDDTPTSPRRTDAAPQATVPGSARHPG
jgi:predicted O-methyltransferase YrrM